MKFCPRCGSTNKYFINGFCFDCFVHDHPNLVTISDRLEVNACPTCLRVFSHGSWISGSDSNLQSHVQDAVKTELDNVRITSQLVKELQKGARYQVNVTGELQGQPVQFEKAVSVLYVKHQCDVCAKKESTYYEVLLQLRPKDGTEFQEMNNAFRVLRNSNRAATSTDRKAEIFRVEEMHNGINVYFGSKRSAKKALQTLLKTYKAEVKESHTLVGVDKKTGKNRYNSTYLVRI